MVTIELQGVSALLLHLQRLQSQALPAGQTAMVAEAERILDASLPLVPIDTGLLVSSGMVESQPGGADIRYGGHGLAPYAALIETDTTMNHPNGGQANYLRDAVLAALPGMGARLGTALATALRS